VSYFAPLSPEAARQLLGEVVKSFPFATAVLDREMRYLAYNRSWLSSHGIPEDRAIVGLRHYDVSPEIRDEWRQVHQRCLAGATERRDDDVYEQVNGRRVHHRWVVAPWRESDGAVGGIIIYVENITDQVETTRNLAEREGLIRTLFEQCPIGLNLCRMDGLWIESNPAFLEIIGYSREEADGGLTYWQLTPRKYDAAEAVQLESLKTTRRYGPYDKEFVRKDGRLVPVRLNGFIVEHDGMPCIWSLIEDLTEQRALETRVEEERLKAIHASRLAVVGEMAAGVAHELNNPLAIISGYAFTLRSAIARGDEAEIKEALAAIDEATERAGTIVKGLRKFSRQKLGHAPTDLVATSSLVADAVNLCRSRLLGTGVRIESDVRTTAQIVGNGLELSQVFVNLLNNALDAVAAAENKWVRIVAKEGQGPSSVTIAVEDSGPRIPPDVADQIFRPFFTTKTVGEGTGLGLSISRSIIEGHGGTLTLDADAPCTRFVVHLQKAP
jgi:PAS domain S-box-containing protein